MTYPYDGNSLNEVRSILAHSISGHDVGLYRTGNKYDNGDIWYTQLDRLDWETKCESNTRECIG